MKHIRFENELPGLYLDNDDCKYYGELLNKFYSEYKYLLKTEFSDSRHNGGLQELINKLSYLNEEKHDKLKSFEKCKDK